MKKVLSYILMFAVAAYLLNYGMRLLGEVWPGLVAVALIVLAGIVWYRVKRFNDSNKY